MDAASGAHAAAVASVGLSSFAQQHESPQCLAKKEEEVQAFARSWVMNDQRLQASCASTAQGAESVLRARWHEARLDVTEPTSAVSLCVIAVELIH